MEEMFGFEDALIRMFTGKKVCREAWDGGDRYVEFVQDEALVVEEGEDVPEVGEREGKLLVRLANDRLIPWPICQTDVLSEDWFEVT